MQNLTQKQQEKIALIDIFDEELIQGNINDEQHEKCLKQIREI